MQKMAAQAKQEEIKSYFNAANDVGNLLIQLGQVTGSKDLQKFGALTVASTQAFYAACQITGSFPGVTAVSGIAMINPTTAMISGTLAIISIFSSNDEENNAMAEMFDQLFSALNTIHREMHEQFDLVHRELFQVFEAVHESIKRNEYNFIKVSDKLEAIARFQEFSHKEIVDAVHTNLLSEISKAIYMIKNDKMSEKLDDKLKHLENLDFANNHLAFDNVLNNPDKSPEYLFIDKSIEQQLEARPLEQNVGFLVGYANKTLSIKNLPTPKEMPNPALFYSISSVLPRFLLDIVNQNTEKVGLLLKTLEPTIATNDKVINAIKAMKQQNVMGAMLKVYNAELNSSGAYIANENEAYSKALGLPKAINYTLPSIAQSYYDNKIETNSQVLDTKYSGSTLIEQKTSSIYINTYRVCVDGAYTMAEKLGLGDNYIEYTKFCHGFIGFTFKRELCIHSIALKTTYTDKTTKAEIPLTCPPDSRVTNALATKLQSLRGDFIDRLTAKSEFKEHILKLKIYEKMAFYYSALTGEAIGVGYAQAFENYLSGAKVIPADEVLVISPVEYFKQKGFWFSDNSTITLAQNKWQASNSTYLDFADSIQQSLNYTSILLNQVKAYNEMPKTDFSTNQAAKGSSKVLKHLKNYFETIVDAKDELVIDFPKGKHKEFGKFIKYFDAAKVQVDEFKAAPTENQLEDLYCNIFCTDKVLKFNVKWYRDAASSDETLLNISNELKDFTEKAVICDC
ncbi:hypothetical protein H1Q59_02190 [Holosporaceae bacterium 'Namur']|nr:hypothetical protein [Holosporaceae bacterium 'Namur']